jgi:hypothetical protein
MLPVAIPHPITSASGHADILEETLSLPFGILKLFEVEGLLNCLVGIELVAQGKLALYRSLQLFTLDLVHHFYVVIQLVSC